MTEADGLRACLDDCAKRLPDAPAILDVSGHTLSFSELKSARQALEDQLRALGLASGEPIAIIMASGPELAVSMLAIVSFATCLPIDPSLTPTDVSELLRRCGVAVILHDADHTELAAESSRTSGVKVWLLSHTSTFGQFVVTGDSLRPRGPIAAEPHAAPNGNDIAALMATSGTSGRPKIIPLRHRNVLASVAALTSALNLGPQDRALAIVPFWFGQGFVSTLVTSLCTGGSVVCPRAMVTEQFGGWLTELKPTWYTAPPSLHSHVLDATRDAVPEHRLRFIRAAGSSLPQEMGRALESRFGVPVIDVYGLTEALGVAVAGLPTTATVAIVDTNGSPVRPGESGEIIIRGPMVVDGYVDDPAGTAARFRDGWLYTGDLGRLDDAGYLFVSGRAGDMINRGGQKISPMEVEAALRTHPGISDVAVFAVAHPVNGEEVAAAVVARRGYRLSERQLRRFARSLLPDWKVPRVIVLVPELPQTSSGKVPRSQLAARLGVSSRDRQAPTAADDPPISPVEQAIAALFIRHLNVPRIGRLEDFFDMGGDSFKAFQVVQGIETSLGHALPVSAVYRWPTVAGLAKRIEGLQSGDSGTTALSTDAARLTLVNILYTGSLDSVGQFLDPNVDVVDIAMPRTAILDGERQTLEALAAHCASELEAVCPEGPYVLWGHSFAALLAFETAVQLRAEGKAVSALILVDRAAPNAKVTGTRLMLEHVRSQRDHLRTMTFGAYSQRLVGRLSKMARRGAGGLIFRLSRVLRTPVPAAAHKMVPYRKFFSGPYRPGRFDGDVLLFRTIEKQLGRDNARHDLGWGAYVTGRVEVAEIEGDHLSMLTGPGARAIAERVNALMDRQRWPAQ